MIVNKVNLKMYVGQSRDIAKRFYCHGYISKKKASTYIHRAIKKYGEENFDFLIWEECSHEELNEKESYLIKELETLAPGGYNCTTGGDCCKVCEESRLKMSIDRRGEKSVWFGKHHTEETKRKIGDKQLGSKNHNYGKATPEDVLIKISESHKGDKNHFYGKKHTEETKKKIAESRKGKLLSEETKKKISLSVSGEKNGHFGMKHTEEAKKAMSEKKKGKPNKKLRGRIKSREERINSARSHMHGRKVACSNGKIYLSVLEAGEDTKIKKQSISDAIQNKRKINGILFWIVYPEQN